MLHTTLCDLFGIELPIIQAPIAPYTSAQLVAAVSNAGGLGSIGTALQSIDDVKKLVDQTQELTKRPSAMNYTSRTLNEDIFKFALEKAILASSEPATSFVYLILAKDLFAFSY
jgi:enoyl-[acyl-carrier protein] reductase II